MGKRVYPCHPVGGAGELGEHWRAIRQWHVCLLWGVARYFYDGGFSDRYTWLVEAVVPVRVRLSAALVRLGFPRDWFLIPLGAVVGVLAGLVAMGFAWMVSFSEGFFFERLAHAGGRWGVYLLLGLPALGGLAVGVIQHFVARGPVGHGVPEVIEALARRQGRLRGREGVLRAVTASLTIGSGGSAGEEGPIVQIGSVLGSVVGRVLRVGSEHMSTLVGCGAAAGLASLFNAPIAGVLFVLEVMLRNFSLKTFMPIVIASVMGTAVAQAVHGHSQAVFTLENLLGYEFALRELGMYALLGVLCGLVGYVFSRVMYRSEKWWAKVPVHAALRPALGGALLGVLGLVFLWGFGEEAVPGYEAPAFFANGYPVIEALLEPGSYGVGGAVEGGVGGEVGGGGIVGATAWFLLAVVVLKMVGTGLTLGSGGSGGVFAPSLFMGAALGALFGLGVRGLGWFEGVTPATYALAGMAGVLAGCVHCPLTAFLMVFEITRDYKAILPVMLVAILATGIAQALQRDSVYGMALRERGVRMDLFTDMTLLRRIVVSQVPLIPVVPVHPAESAQRLLDLAVDSAVTDYVVCDERNRYIGMVVGQDVRTTLLEREAVPLMIVGELMRRDLATVSSHQTLDVVLDKFARHDVASLAVVDESDERVVGLITRAKLMQFYQRELERED